MRHRMIKITVSFCLIAALVITAFNFKGAEIKAAPEDIEAAFVIEESEINKLLTDDLVLPTSVNAAPQAEINYSLNEGTDSRYVKIEGNTLKITRPYAGTGDYSFVLKGTLNYNGQHIEKEFPLTIADGVSEDTYAGYVYACFGNKNGADVQQLHLFLSEDGLNWTALNGFNPVFNVGTDYIDKIKKAGTHNYTVAEGTDITATTSGDASVLFPFEGIDNGIRDPYIIRGCRKDDSDKIWILATDLNTMASRYGGNLNNNTVGNWGTMSTSGSTSLFIYETSDWVHWERRYVDVGKEINAGAAWAPEAIYNPDKDNYLVYWSCRVATDGFARNRLYCNETKDFKTFGPTKMYEEEDFYKKWGKYVNANDGYGNIDTSQLWVSDGDNPYGKVYRVVKDETNNHIELMSADSILNPEVDYDASDPNRITPFTLDGKTYSSLSDITSLDDYTKAEVVWNWFANESTGNHFKYIKQSNMEKYAGAYEGSTMFKFNDRDEWCVMIDFYGNNNVRYEPYITRDLSKENSITKVTSGYGRTGGDVGCHGGMIPITAKEYNTLIDTYNADPSVDNYHDIAYIEYDTRDPSVCSVNITVSESEVVINKGEQKTVTASADDNSQDITWNSADETVAVVENGTITGVGEGSTFVFAKLGKRALAMIRVEIN